MIRGRKVVVASLMAFAMTVGVYADMMPIPGADSCPASAPRLCDHPDPSHADGPDLIFEFIPASLDLLPLACSVGLPVEIDSTSPAGPTVVILSQDRSSLDLCLYALVSLGLCHSGRWVRKASLGFVPDWYHSGGPFQVGHSTAVSPDRLCPVPVCCFIQRDGTADHPLSPSRTDAIASLRHPSQHTPASLISRGPPILA